MNILKFLAKKSPAIMLGLGIGSAVAAVIATAKATPKVLAKIEETKATTFKEKAKVSWKYYIPAGVFMMSSMALLIGSYKVTSKRVAGLAAACGVAETALMQYKDAVKEVAPEVKEKIEDAVCSKQIQQGTKNESNVYILGGSDDVMCYDPLSDRYFPSNKEKIKEAVNDLNRDMLYDGFGGSASLNDFYEKLNLHSNDLGKDVGWNTSNGLMEIRFSSQLDPNGKPCLVLVYDRPPIHDFDR